MRVPKKLYSDVEKLREYCVKEAAAYLGLLLAIDMLDNDPDFRSIAELQKEKQDEST